MKITLGVLAGIAITFVLMSLTVPQENNIPRYHITSHGNMVVYDAITGKAVGLVTSDLRALKNGTTTIKEILDAAQ